MKASLSCANIYFIYFWWIKRFRTNVCIEDWYQQVFPTWVTFESRKVESESNKNDDWRHLLPSKLCSFPERGETRNKNKLGQFCWRLSSLWNYRQTPICVQFIESSRLIDYPRNDVTNRCVHYQHFDSIIQCLKFG